MPYDKVILGKDCVYDTDPDSGVNQNILVFGGTGSGKTMSIAEPRLLEANYSSLVVTVTKRRLISMYRDLFSDRGYEVLELNFVDPDESSIGWDPLDPVCTEEDITHLARAIVMSNSKKERTVADVFWDDAATDLLSAEIALVLLTRERACFADVLELVDELRVEDSGLGGGEAVRTNQDMLFDTLARVQPKCFALSCWRTFRQLPLRTSLCVFGTLNAAMASLFPPKVRRLFRMERRLRFEEIACRKTLLFAATSPVNPALYRLVSIFYSQLIKTLFEFGDSQPEGHLPIPVHLLCDDFAVGGRILHFDEYISCFREIGMSCTLLLQSRNQLISTYGEAEACTILDNSDTVVYLGGNDLGTAREISLRANLPLEDVLCLPIGQVYIFRRGQLPLRTLRYDIRSDRRYLENLAAWKEIIDKAPRRIALQRDEGKGLRGSVLLPGFPEERKDGGEGWELTGEARTLDDRLGRGDWEKGNPSLEQVIDMIKRQIVHYEQAGMFVEKADKMKELSDYYRKLYGEEDERTLAMMQNAVNEYVLRSAHAEARRILEKLYPIRLRRNGPKDEKTLRIMAIMAICCESLGERRKAKSFLAKLEEHGAQSMPELVWRTRAECERRRAARRK